jgi:NAD(P)-dependent dehydrogenase (short-subunit alcohol dehydrogenase family)
MNKVWLVTGSASGLGRNIAEAVLESGNHQTLMKVCNWPAAARCRLQAVNWSREKMLRTLPSETSLR